MHRKLIISELKKIVWMILFIGINIDIYGQQNFAMSYVNKKDTTYFYLHNNTTDTINGVAINATWFHMGEGLLFWPEDMLTGLSVYKTQGNYIASNLQFKFKSYQRMSFDFFVPHGDSQLFAKVVNYVSTSDTIMCANLQLWYLDDMDSLHNERVLPTNSKPNDCAFEQYYLVSNLGKSDGIKLGSAANYTLHRSNQCTVGLAIVVIDRNTLMPTPVNGITPNCEDGRKWTTFGYPTNEQVFYYFNMNDTSSISQIIELIEAIPAGDHVFISTLGTTETDFQSTRMKNALKLIGAKGNETRYNLHSYKTYCAFGSKGAAAGSFYGQGIQPLQSSDYTLREYVFFPGSYYDSSSAFSTCYEKGISIIMPEQPKQNSLQTIKKSSSWFIYPNPINNSNTLKLKVKDNYNTWIFNDFNISVYNSIGRSIPIEWEILDKKYIQVSLQNLNPGIYFLKLNNESQKFLVN